MAHVATLQSGPSIPAWVTGLAFISADLRGHEVIGRGASGAKDGIATSHFDWVGAIPALVFVGVPMMPFDSGSRARSAPAVCVENVPPAGASAEVRRLTPQV